MRAVLLLCWALASQAVAAPVEKLRMLSYELPPFMHADVDRRPQGAAIDMVRELFSRIDVRPQLQVYPLARSLAMFNSGYAGGIFVVRKTPERAARYVFSNQPLFMQETVLFVRKDSSVNFKGSLRVLAGCSIGLLRGGSYGDVFDAAAANGLFARVEFVARDESNFRKLQAGRIDAVIGSREAGLATLRRLGIADQIRVTGKPLETSGSYLMFRKDAVDADFLRKLNAAIAGMQRDGSTSRILARYGLR